MEFDCRHTPIGPALEIAFSQVKRATHWRVDLPKKGRPVQRLILAGGGDPDEMGGFTRFLTALTAEEAQDFILAWLKDAGESLVPDEEEVKTWRISNRGAHEYGPRAFVVIEPILEDCLK